MEEKFGLCLISNFLAKKYKSEYPDGKLIFER